MFSRVFIFVVLTRHFPVKCVVLERAAWGHLRQENSATEASMYHASAALCSRHYKSFPQVGKISAVFVYS